MFFLVKGTNLNLTNSTKGTNSNPSLSTTGVSFSTIFGILNTLEACVIISMKLTFILTPIYGIFNRTSLGVTGSSNSSTWVLTITISVSIDSMGKGKVQEIVISSTPPLVCYGSFMVVTIDSFQFENS